MATDKDNNETNNLNCNPSSPEYNVPPANQKRSCCASLKMFLFALSFSYFTKAYSGSYMKSSVTQIERRFDISSSTVGMVDGSFEFGNLLAIAFVSYFGAKMHRPRIIAIGCIVMSLGSFLTAMPHFFMGPYKYESARTSASLLNNVTESVSSCMANRTFTEQSKLECAKDNNDNYMWVYVLIGNMLRGIGETPITPLGIAYIDDFASAGNTALYLACLHAVGMFGPMVGFMMSSYFAKLYVDVGFVNTDTITITPRDTRWVGAWWMGFLLAGMLNLLAAIPFWFLPKSLEKQDEVIAPGMLIFKNKEELEPQKKATVKGFLMALKRLMSNPLYLLLLLMTLLQINSFLGFITYKPKFMEQQYGQSISKSNFITGVTTLPAAALGMFLGGFIMKRYKFGLLSASKMSFITSFTAFLLSMVVFIIGCENNDVAGITITYNGSKVQAFHEGNFFSSCNSHCQCSTNQWDPVCGENGITYMSACLAGCASSTGAGKNMVHHNCSCIEAMGFASMNSSVKLGTCPRGDSCSRMFLYYVILQVFSTFVFALGGSAAYVIVLWSVSPELKSLAMGVYMLLVRALGGIPAPIYFGALIDKTCLKWGTKICGGRGACRMYDAESFRNTFMGLTVGIRAPTYILFFLFICLVKKRMFVKSPENGVQKEDGSTTKDAHPEEATKEECTALGEEKETCM
ncbi:solute carrier organic anion transporter family member 1B3-like [Hyperolius riggenbachi]|uniref:solute carrier organic anion transporter family member 1B3-like n=1 Tax=Hyperolius riggenbachi TaxID=752182 RepID=UPI0035A2A246